MRRRRVGILAVVLCALVGLNAGAADAAKKKPKKSPKTFEQSRVVNATILDDAATGPSTPLTSTITVPKAFKGKVAGDVNVTGIQTTGSATGSADDLIAKLTAPNGNTVQLWNTGLGDVSIGPLTLDDDVRTSICDSATLTCSNPNQTLLRPFAGTANLLFLGSQGTGPLSSFDGAPLRGDWTLTIWDEANIGNTSVLNGWGLKITAAKPAKV